MSTKKTILVTDKKVVLKWISELVFLARSKYIKTPDI